MRKRYLNDSEFAALSDRELKAELKKCELMSQLGGSAVGRKAFRKRAIEISTELQKRAHRALNGTP